MNLPPYPQALKDFLAEDCTIWPGKKRAETHIVVPLFPQIAFQDLPPTPLTLKTLNLLDKSSKGPGCNQICPEIRMNIPGENEFHYAAITNDVLPESRNKSYKDQLQLIPSGYKPPQSLDVASAIIWESRHSGKHFFTNATYTRCEDFLTYGEIRPGIGEAPIYTRHHLIVGGFSPNGLKLYKDEGDGAQNPHLGLAAIRKF